LSVSTSTRVIGYRDGAARRKLVDYFCSACGLKWQHGQIYPITESQAYAEDLSESCAICGAEVPPRVPFQ
jgi:hypothetical protein